MTESSRPYLLSIEASLTDRAWQLRVEDERLGMTIAQRLDVPEIIGRVLAGRGVTLDDAQSYLDPSIRTHLSDPSCVADMDRAADRVAEAVMSGERIAIFGDYDVDGATSSAVLSRFLSAVGEPPRTYIPDRQREGYGPNKAAFDTLAQEGIQLVITVDCGTMAFDALTHAAGLGLEVIVVDHHQPEAQLPEAVGIVNPNRLDDSSGYGQLAAVGVSYLLAIAVNRVLRQKGWYETAHTEPDLLSLLDLVALGTVCDVVPLKGLNRAFVAQGLKVMERRQNIGLNTLIDIAKVNGSLGTYELGFMLGPRVNAGGRVGKSDLGSRLLTTQDPLLATDLAIELDRLNQERKAIEAQVESAALAQMEQRFQTGRCAAYGHRPKPRLASRRHRHRGQPIKGALPTPHLCHFRGRKRYRQGLGSVHFRRGSGGSGGGGSDGRPADQWRWAPYGRWSHRGGRQDRGLARFP